jgi:hypothetical protein
LFFQTTICDGLQVAGLGENDVAPLSPTIEIVTMLVPVGAGDGVVGGVLLPP